MPDVFENISGSMGETSPPTVDKSAKTQANDKPSTSKTSEEVSKDRGSKPCKDSASSSKSSSTEKSIDKLAKVMESGFKDLKGLLQEQHLQNARLFTENEDLDSVDYEDFSDCEALDMFDNFAEEMTSSESIGADVRPSLAGLADKLLHLKLGDSVVKSKRELYPKPNNVKFLSTPKINKPMWETLNYTTQIKDSQLQSIEKDFLASAIPTIKVMEKIFEAKDDMASLTASELIDMLKDSFLFLGCANTNMVKLRRDNVKRVLPKHMQGLCGDHFEFSSTHLFGDDLNASIKEVSELNKISNSFKPKVFLSRAGRRGSVLRSARSRGSARGSSNRRPFRRYKPYDASNKKPLNRQSPSQK